MAGAEESAAHRGRTASYPTAPAQTCTELAEVSRRAVFPHRALQKYSLPQSSSDQLKLSRLGPSFDSWLLYPVVLK